MLNLHDVSLHEIFQECLTGIQYDLPVL